MKSFSIAAQITRLSKGVSSRLRNALLASCLTVLAGCQDNSKVRDRALQWSFNLAWSVGGTTDNRVSFSLLYPFEIGSDSSDHLYILDGPGHRVFVIGSDGVIVDSLGREGQGPGEFRDPWAIAITANEIAVADLATRRIVRWTQAGEPLDPIPIRDALWEPKFQFSEGSILYTTVGPAGGGQEQYLLVRTGPSGKSTVITLAKQGLRVGDFPSCHATGIATQPLFAPTLHWDAGHDRVVVNADVGYVIEVFKDGKHVKTISRAIVPAPASRAAAQLAARNWRFNDCIVPPDEVIRTTGFLDVIPVIEALALSPTGELWVLRRGDTGDSLTTDVFDSAGSYVGSLPAGAPFPVAFLPGGRIAAIDKDSLDVPRVTVYDIQR